MGGVWGGGIQELPPAYRGPKRQQSAGGDKPASAAAPPAPAKEKKAAAAAEDEDIWFDDVDQADIERARDGEVSAATKTKKLVVGIFTGYVCFFIIIIIRAGRPFCVGMCLLPAFLSASGKPPVVLT